MTTLDTPTVGTYLIRPSDSGLMHVLTMQILDTNFNKILIRNYRINSDNGQLFIAKQRVFSDIFALVEHYKHIADGLPCNLRKAVPKQRPIIYPRRIEIQRKSIDFVRSFQAGNFGELYRAKMCKTYDVTIVTNCKSKLDPFLAEADILFKFRKSKHFVRLIGVVLEPEPFMIVLGEAVQDTLQDYLRKNAGNVSFRTLIVIVSEVANGMAFLEDNGIVHGYLKAENVFVCGLTKIMHPKLIKLMKTSENDKHAKDEQEWQWTAPEVIEDENALSIKSDVWSFGVLMYEVITLGKIPYEGLEKGNTLRAICNKRKLPLPIGGLVHCPIEYYNIILQCWHRIPECRLTFAFLGDFLCEFDVSVETENLLKDVKLKDMYMSGTLMNESELMKEIKDSKTQTYVKFKGAVTSEHDEKISFERGDILTNIEPVDDDWWIGTTSSNARGKFPTSYVEVCENAYSQVTKL